MFRIALALAISAIPMISASPAQAAQASASTYPQLLKAFEEWRALNQPKIANGRPDYGPSAMAEKAGDLANLQLQMTGLNTDGWTASQKGDYRLMQAEMSGLDFYFRVLKPWARDPGFYQTVFPEMSDVPAHEGTYAEPVIDLFAYRWPLNAADQKRLTAQLATIPPLLTDARANLAGSTAHDLWAYGDRAFREQAEALAALEAGTLSLNDLDGRRTASLLGASPQLKKAVAEAREATVSFADWIKSEAPKRQGPSGVGKDNYNWYLKHVLLGPYDFDQQVTLLRRELDRSLASLRLEEVRNRTAPPIPEIKDPAAYKAMALAREERLYRLLVDAGFIADKPYFRSALFGQLGDYTPVEQRNFFTHVTALDPLPLSSHQFHWIELARLRQEPHPSPIRQTPPLFNIYADRSEGLATAMEEVLMQAGLYDDEPHGRELVWIMLANRAARGLASLRVQANEIGLDEAGKYHASWTPRGWSDANSRLVGFEQLLYLRQPGYGPSYIIGKTQLDHLLAKASHQADIEGRPFSSRDTFAAIWASGIVPFAIIEDEFLEPAN
ncbi:hypothetical protein GCM10023264_28660 [Sphingomonas daechungensis]|uniref:DUF885 family protein n=1 Tax=Sphingomonas daechungensis TaxID=1176646 RepID=A0ABX6T058_9SPHN|nr:DUF885 family protein [Sphingomonas daechungensis]QNP42435.1 DUF885 family protein [Sphingomonas daechungensis]